MALTYEPANAWPRLWPKIHGPYLTGDGRLDLRSGSPRESHPVAPTDSVRDSLPSYGSCHPGHQAAGTPSPVGEEPGVLAGDASPARQGLVEGPQPRVFLAGPAHQVGVDASQEGIQRG